MEVPPIEWTRDGNAPVGESALPAKEAIPISSGQSQVMDPPHSPASPITARELQEGDEGAGLVASDPQQVKGGASLFGFGA